MKITLNDKILELESPLNLEEFVLSLGYETTVGIALAVNTRIIPKTEWKTTLIEDEMQITLFQATCGG